MDISVVVLQCLVVALSFDGDAVFGAGELILQAQEVFVGFKLRIILHNREQPSKCTVELLVGCNLLLRRAGRKQCRAGLGNIAENLLLLLRITLHSLDQIRNQVSTALQHDVHLRPCRLNRLVFTDQRVAHAHVLSKDKKGDQH